MELSRSHSRFQPASVERGESYSQQSLMEQLPFSWILSLVYQVNRIATKE